MQKVSILLGKQQLQEIKDITAYETMETFFNTVFCYEMVDLAGQQWQESIQNLQRTKRMEELGLKSSPDVAELAAKEVADSYNLTRQKNLLKISIIRLKEKMYFPIGLVKAKYGQTLTDFSRLDDWGDLLILTGQVNFDHLLVIISARRGSISYDSSFEKLPAQISKYFANNSLIVLYPDQLGEPQDAVSFSNPRGNNESQHYEKVGKWFYKWFKKN